jgi:ribosomal protein S6
MLQMTFNCKPQVLEDLKHDMHVDERVMRFVAIKKRALKSLISYKARDPAQKNGAQAKLRETLAATGYASF